jgi:hypothetical protein
MAVWLAERVGQSGQVVATDIDVTYVKRLNLLNSRSAPAHILDGPVYVHFLLLNCLVNKSEWSDQPPNRSSVAGK